MLTDCQLDRMEHTSMKLNQHMKIFFQENVYYDIICKTPSTESQLNSTGFVEVI